MQSMLLSDRWPLDKEISFVINRPIVNSPVQVKYSVSVFRDRDSDRDRDKMNRDKNYIDRDRVRYRDAKLT